MPRRQWTMRGIKDAKRRWEDGETWRSVAAEYGVSDTTLRTLVNRYLGKPRKNPHRDKNPKHAALVLEAIALRNTKGYSWPRIAQELDSPITHGALYKAAQRYVEVVGGNIEPGYGIRVGV